MHVRASGRIAAVDVSDNTAYNSNATYICINISNRTHYVLGYSISRFNSCVCYYNIMIQFYFFSIPRLLSNLQLIRALRVYYTKDAYYEPCIIFYNNSGNPKTNFNKMLCSGTFSFPTVPYTFNMYLSPAASAHIHPLSYFPCDDSLRQL